MTAPKIAPPVPDQITVGPTDYTVVVDKDRARDANVSFGFTDYTTAEIVVHPDQAPGQMRDTMLHEPLHAMFFALGFGKGEKPACDHRRGRRREPVDRRDDPVVHALATLLLDTLRRNPALVAYLTAP